MALILPKTVQNHTPYTLNPYDNTLLPIQPQVPDPHDIQLKPHTQITNFTPKPILCPKPYNLVPKPEA